MVERSNQSKAKQKRDAYGLNPLERSFVTHVVAGMTQTDAWMLAWSKDPAKYDRNAASVNGCQVAARPHVAREIESLKSAAVEQARARAIAKAAIGREYVMHRLHEVVERCMQHAPVLDRQGKPVTAMRRTDDGTAELVAVYAFDPKGALGGLGLLGKEFGMFADKTGRGAQAPMSDKSDAELDDLLLAAAAELAQLTGKRPSIPIEMAPMPLAVALAPTDPPPPPTGGVAETRVGPTPH